MPTTWSGTDKDTQVTLSGTNHTATISTTGADAGVRGNTSHNSGKWYLEYSGIVLGGFHSKYGFATGGAALHPINSAGTFGSGEGGNADGSGAVLGSPVGHTIQLCIDVSAGKYWLRYDGTAGWYGATGAVGLSTDPTNGLNGADYTAFAAAGVSLFPFLCGFSNAGTIVTDTLNCGDSAFVSAPPSGFTAWDATVPIPKPFATVIS